LAAKKGLQILAKLAKNANFERCVVKFNNTVCMVCTKCVIFI